MPKTLKGTIFTEVIPHMLPEIDFVKLVQLGTIVKAKEKTKMYESLKTSLRKIQWVRFVGLKAIAIEHDIKKQVEPNQLLMDPLGQIDHSLSITDLLIHTKSALDSMAIFLTDLLKLNVKGGGRDLKKPKFRNAVRKADSYMGRTIDQLESWFVYVQEVRDEWIHRDSVRSFIVTGSTDVGVLPVPKKPSLVGKLPPADLQITSRDFWSTQEFVEYHYSRLVILFKAIVDRSIQIELNTSTSKAPSPEPAEILMSSQAIFFPTRVTQNMIVRKMKVSAIDFSAYFKRLSESFSLGQI